MNLYLFWLLIEENYKNDHELREFTEISLGGAFLGFFFGFAPMLMVEHPLADDVLVLLAILLVIGLGRLFFRPLCALWSVRN